MKEKDRNMSSRTQAGSTSTIMRLSGIEWVSKHEGQCTGGTGRLFRISRISTKEKGMLLLFSGFGIFFHVIIFDFKFGSIAQLVLKIQYFLSQRMDDDCAI